VTLRPIRAANTAGLQISDKSVGDAVSEWPTDGGHRFGHGIDGALPGQRGDIMPDSVAEHVCHPADGFLMGHDEQVQPSCT
jgi:hypothetical protein